MFIKMILEITTSRHCIEKLSADKNQDGELSASELTSPAEKAFKVLDQNLSLKIMGLKTKHCQRHNGPEIFEWFC